METGILNVTLWYSIDNGTTWIPINMAEISPNTYQATIPGFEQGTYVSYKIVAYDNAENMAVKDNNGYNYTYNVIPKFQLTQIFLLIATSTIIVLVIIVSVKKRFRAHK